MFRCIAADPPWMERGGGKIKRGADRHYPLMTRQGILRTMLTSEVWRPDLTGCHLWLWVTRNHLTDGLWLMDALEFKHKTQLNWLKVSRLGKLQQGLGQYLRGTHELCLLGSRGRAMLPKKALPDSIMAPRTLHSRKPDEAFELIEKISAGPRLEMFARTPRSGWTVWGDGVL